MIEAMDIVKTFRSGKKKVPVLSRVSFALEKGQTLTIAGKSGSGKTTLLNCLGGLEKPDSGRIRCFGVDVTALSGKSQALFQREKVGFVFQYGNLLSYLTVSENISFPLVLNRFSSRKKEMRIKGLLEELELTGLSRAMPHELSGGQAQRVAFARAIAHVPALLLADEPTASLDTATGRNLIRLMVRMGRENGVTIIASTHDNEIIRHSDRTIWLTDGKITG
ncbi:ABC transporter ATP-binding protein [Desulfospira joergensenii]|uniref:ABC transporter ATP-binding protein n=1 Tax=Desulfospira joergensenii TaxID=53329 RepID=UPI000685E34B|nr:ABC transporter ATP-binding protein [Desulfospira joergensenii]